MSFTHADVVEGEQNTIKSVVNDVTTTMNAEEPASLAYQPHLSADGTTIGVYERYTDASAAVQHDATRLKFQGRLDQVRHTKGTIVCGPVSDGLKALLEPTGASIYTKKIAGFSRNE